jgi:hypothetical protein
VRTVAEEEALDIRLARQRLASESTARYVQEAMGACREFRSRLDLLAHSLTLAQPPGLFLEFGVGRGATVNFTASRVNGFVHGFDSFHGLPEDFGAWESVRGTFSTDGALPEVRSNVVLHPGLFDDSLPEFVRTYDDPVAWVHADCVLYSSTGTVLGHLRPRIRPGTVLVFDEYFNYPNWEQDGEYRAFQEFVAQHGVRYRYVSYMSNGNSVAVMVEGGAPE